MADVAVAAAMVGTAEDVAAIAAAIAAVTSNVTPDAGEASGVAAAPTLVDVGWASGVKRAAGLAVTV